MQGSAWALLPSQRRPLLTSAVSRCKEAALPAILGKPVLQGFFCILLLAKGGGYSVNRKIEWTLSLFLFPVTG